MALSLRERSPDVIMKRECFFFLLTYIFRAEVHSLPEVILVSAMATKPSFSRIPMQNVIPQAPYKKSLSYWLYQKMYHKYYFL